MLFIFCHKKQIAYQGYLNDLFDFIAKTYGEDGDIIEPWEELLNEEELLQIKLVNSNRPYVYQFEYSDRTPFYSGR
jgi:hypothetical protein